MHHIIKTHVMSPKKSTAGLKKYTKKRGLDRKEVWVFFSLIIFMTSPTQQIALLETSDD